MTDKVGAVLAEHNHRAPAAEVCAAPAQDMILQVDGGHIPLQEQDKRSFEALSAIVYRPDIGQYLSCLRKLDHVIIFKAWFEA